MLAKLQPQMQPDRAGPGCFKLQHSSCWRNPQGSLSNNHTAHYKVSSVVPQIYIQTPHMWKDDLLLCQGSIWHHGAAACIVLPLCISSESQCPDKSFLPREAFADNVIWGYTKKQLLLLDEHLENSPCAASASGCFLSHICYETYSRTEKFTGSWCQQQGEASYYLVLQHSSLTELGTGSPAHPKDRDTTKTALPLSPRSMPRCHAPRAKGIFCFAPIWEKRETNIKQQPH